MNRERRSTIFLILAIVCAANFARPQTAKAGCSYCTTIIGSCCGDVGQLSCAGFGLESKCNYDCKDGLRYKVSSGTCEEFADCDYCQSTFGHCCGALGEVSCLGTGEKESGSCNYGCQNGLVLRDAVCQEPCSYCTTVFGNCCGDEGQTSCAGIGEPAESSTCNATCKTGYCYDFRTFHCEACDSCDDDSVFTLGPCGESYERACNTATLQGCPACESGYEYDWGTFEFDATDKCQPDFVPPSQSIPDTGFDFSFVVVGDVHVGDIARGDCEPQSAYGVLTDFINKLGSSGLTWPDDQVSGKYVFEKHGQAISQPLAVVMVGDMTHRGSSTSDLVNFSRERKALQDYWDERREHDDNGPSIDLPVYPGLGNHDLIQCDHVEFSVYHYLIPGGALIPLFDALPCAIRMASKNNIMTGYMESRMKDESGINYDDDTENYSWDWGPFHMVQGNLWAGEFDSLDWLKKDLETHVGDSGKPVILFQHFGWDSFSKELRCNDGSGDNCASDADCASGVECIAPWWDDDDRDDLKTALDPYNVIAIFTGHVHTPMLISASSSSGPGIDNFITDDGGDDDECHDADTVTDACTTDADCNDNFGCTTDTCNSDSECEYEYDEDCIEGDGGFYLVRLSDAGNGQAHFEVLALEWDEGMSSAADMTHIPASFNSPTTSSLIYYDAVPPNAVCANATVSADSNCESDADIDDGSSDPDGPDPTCVQSPAGPYALGTTSVTLDCTDSQGLTDSCSADVTVEDTTAPTIDMAASDATVQCDGAGNGGDLTNWLDDYAGADASDACDTSVAWSDDFSSLSDDCGATGTATVTFTAEDDSGNTSLTTATFTIEDTTAPTFSSCPGTIYQESPAGSCTDDVSYSVAASDVCGSTSISCVPDNAGATSVTAAGGTFPVGTTTVTCTATDDCGLSSVCSFDVIVNDPPQITSVSTATQSVQYSDKIVPVVVTATDCGPGSSLTLEFDAADVPNGLALSSTADSCGLNASNVVECTWTLDNDDRMLEPEGTYAMDGLKAVDPTPLNGVTLKSAPDESITVEVNAENATIAFDGGNPVAVQVATDGGNSGPFDLTVDVQELFPEVATAGGELPGDIGLAVMSMTLAPVGPGGPVSGICTPDNVPTAYDYSGVLSVTCQFDDVEVNTYTIEALLIANASGELYYTGSNEDVLVVFDPSLGFTTGGGHFYWPGTTDRTNFGYTMKYNKKRTNIQGSLLLIRHLSDGTKYRIKSNALYGLAIGDESGFGWASFAGKCTYQDPGMNEPEGNHEFVTYVEDLAEPGAGSDRFWLESLGKDGTVILDLSFDERAFDNAATIVGGNIVVPHQGQTR